MWWSGSGKNCRFSSVEEKALHMEENRNCLLTKCLQKSQLPLLDLVFLKPPYLSSNVALLFLPSGVKLLCLPSDGTQLSDGTLCTRKC